MWKEHLCTMRGFACLSACLPLACCLPDCCLPHPLLSASVSLAHSACLQTKAPKIAPQGSLTPDPVQGGQACKSNKGSKPSVDPPESLTLRKTMKFLPRHFSIYPSIPSLSTW